MKKSYIIPTSLVALATIVTVSSASVLAANNGYGQSSINRAKGSNASSNLATDTLNEQDKQSLLFMIEEEKLAHDLYVAFYEKWGVSAFNTISKSETSHQKSVANVLQKYNISDPRISEAGKFTNQDLQKLYDSLLARGLTSSADALAVGVDVEKKDIADLQQAMNATSNATLDTMYGRLLKGSENHLRAFSRVS